MAALSFQQRFGHHLAELRRQAGLTQEELAELANGSVDTISSLERGIRAPSFDLLEQRAQALQFSPSELFAFGSSQSLFENTPGTAAASSQISIEGVGEQLFPDEGHPAGRAKQLQLSPPIRHTGTSLSREEIVLLHEYLTIYLSLPGSGQPSASKGTSFRTWPS
jgi:transcriptional regulator with XRE-family HTH domain